MPGASPSNGIARVVFWLIFVFFLFSAIGALKIPALTTFMNQVLAYLPNVIVAIVIFVVAALIAGAVAAARRQAHGRHPDRQDRRHGRAGHRHGHRAVHDPRPAEDRRGDRRRSPSPPPWAPSPSAWPWPSASVVAGVAERMLEDAYRKGKRAARAGQGRPGRRPRRAQAHASHAQSQLQDDRSYTTGSTHDASYGAAPPPTRTTATRPTATRTPRPRSSGSPGRTTLAERRPHRIRGGAPRTTQGAARLTHLEPKESRHGHGQESGDPREHRQHRGRR